MVDSLTCVDWSLGSWYLVCFYYKRTVQVHSNHTSDSQELAEEEKRTGLPAITDEAMRQRDHLMGKAKAMSESTKFEQAQRARDTARFTKDNSELILEMNRLRLEKTQAERKITDLEKSLYTLSTENLQLSQMSGGVPLV